MPNVSASLPATKAHAVSHTRWPFARDVMAPMMAPMPRLLRDGWRLLSSTGRSGAKLARALSAAEWGWMLSLCTLVSPRRLKIYNTL